MKKPYNWNPYDDERFKPGGVIELKTDEDAAEWGYDKEGDLIPKLKIAENRQSDWQVELWGNKSFVMRPAYGDEPNWWVRFWMKIFFNSKWSKV